MRKVEHSSDENLEPLVDTTEALSLRSKRTERAEKKRLKAKKSKPRQHSLLELPYDLLLGILSHLRPSDVFILSRVSKPLRAFINEEETVITRSIRSWRYACLERCFRVPILLGDVDAAVHPLLKSDDREEIRIIRKTAYQHIQTIDPDQICTCKECILRWNSLCILVDFAHWQDNLDQGEPIPMVPRGRNPEWNQRLLAKNAAVVQKALRSPLWHSRLLEEHLYSTTRSIRRQVANKGDRRTKYRMTAEDVQSGIDQFLERTGPPTVHTSFHRDQYYMLEPFLPGRAWRKEEKRWVYTEASSHDTFVQVVVKWAPWLAAKAARERDAKVSEKAAAIREHTAAGDGHCLVGAAEVITAS